MCIFSSLFCLGKVHDCGRRGESNRRRDIGDWRQGRRLQRVRAECQEFAGAPSVSSFSGFSAALVLCRNNLCIALSVSIGLAFCVLTFCSLSISIYSQLGRLRAEQSCQRALHPGAAAPPRRSVCVCGHLRQRTASQQHKKTATQKAVSFSLRIYADLPGHCTSELFKTCIWG